MSGDIFDPGYELFRTIDCVAVDWDRRVAVAATANGRLYAWSLAVGTLIWSIQAITYEPKSGEGITAVAFSADGRRVLASGVAGQCRFQVKAWAANTGKYLGTHAEVISNAPGSCYRCIRSLENDRVILAGDGTVCLWDLANDRNVGTLMDIQPRSLDATPDGSILIGIDYARHIILKKAGGPPRAVWGGPSHDHTSHHRPTTISFLDKEGSRAISGGDAGELVIWDLHNLEIMKVLRGRAYHEPIRSIAVAPARHVALTGSDNGLLQCWDLKHGHVIRTLSAGAPALNVGTELEK